jgi:hypothetical protein
MKEFDVTITERLQKTVTVQAETLYEAEELVNERWNSGEYVLDADNFVDMNLETVAQREIEQEAAEKMTVLLVRPGCYPAVTEIGTGLPALQKAVGGDIEATYPFDDEVALVYQGEGKMNGSELNRALRTEDGDVYDIVAGDFLVVGLSEESFASLTPEQAAHYEKLFHQPEMFVRMGRGVMAIPLPDDMVKTDGPSEDKAIGGKPKEAER